tara:strand:- start:712 stop:1089 length:378 start_codon:yes stop_codon:yes gene_type:complete
VITELQKRRNKLLTFFWILFLTSCSDKSEIIGAKWTGDSDFMFIKENEMRMHYATEISGKTVFIGGFYEIFKSQTSQVMDRLQITQIDFETRTDGVKYCRLWGRVTQSDEECYLLAYKCEPIYSD